MIQRLLITMWLVLSILGYGMVIAADVHTEESPVDHQVVSLGDADDHTGDLHNLTTHNHCGHGSFHLLGLNFTPALPTVCGTHSPKSAYLAAWNSLLDAPPSRPPKA